MPPRSRLLIIIALFAALLPVSAAAQSLDESDDILIRINGPIEVPADQTIDAVVAISDSATVAGVVREAVVVIDGDVTITGRVEGEVSVIRGTLTLGPGASVDDVFLYRSELNRDPSATVLGDIERSNDLSFGRGSAIFSFFFWLGSTIAIVIAGLLFAAIGGKQLNAAGALGTTRVGQSLVATIVLWLVVPVVAVMAMVTLIGIPAGLGILLFLLPALGFLGYIVAGTRIGTLIVRRSAEPADHPFLAATVGLLVLQILALLPILGGFVAVVLGLYGAGCLVYLAIQGWKRPSPQPMTQLQPAIQN